MTAPARPDVEQLRALVEKCRKTIAEPEADWIAISGNKILAICDRLAALERVAEAAEDVRAFQGSKYEWDKYEALCDALATLTETEGK